MNVVKEVRNGWYKDDVPLFGELKDGNTMNETDVEKEVKTVWEEIEEWLNRQKIGANSLRER